MLLSAAAVYVLYCMYCTVLYCTVCTYVRIQPVCSAGCWSDTMVLKCVRFSVFVGVCVCVLVQIVGHSDFGASPAVPSVQEHFSE